MKLGKLPKQETQKNLPRSQCRPTPDLSFIRHTQISSREGDIISLPPEDLSLQNTTSVINIGKRLMGSYCYYVYLTDTTIKLQKYCVNTSPASRIIFFYIDITRFSTSHRSINRHSKTMQHIKMKFFSP